MIIHVERVKTIIYDYRSNETKTVFDDNSYYYYNDDLSFKKNDDDTFVLNTLRPFLNFCCDVLKISEWEPEVYGDLSQGVSRLYINLITDDQESGSITKAKHCPFCGEEFTIQIVGMITRKLFTNDALMVNQSKNMRGGRIGLISGIVAVGGALAADSSLGLGIRDAVTKYAIGQKLLDNTGKKRRGRPRKKLSAFEALQKIKDEIML